MTRHSTQKGFGMVEVVVVAALIAGTLFAFTQAGIVSLRLLRRERENLEATLLAREALEAVRSVRDESWIANIGWRTETPLASPSLPYHPVLAAGRWTLATTSPGLIDGKYARYVEFENVGRDLQDRIVSSGGINDPGTRKVTATASSSAVAITLITYITDFQSYLGAIPGIQIIGLKNSSASTVYAYEIY